MKLTVILREAEDMRRHLEAIAKGGVAEQKLHAPLLAKAGTKTTPLAAAMLARDVRNSYIQAAFAGDYDPDGSRVLLLKLFRAIVADELMQEFVAIAYKTLLENNQQASSP